jgi:hypothetical protein
MKQNFLRLFIFFVFLVGCSAQVDMRDKALISPPEHLAYFGFAGIDCGWDDPHDSEIKTNYLDEVAAFTNVAQLCVYSPDDVLDERLEKFRRANIKAILHVEAILFEHSPDANVSSGSKATLREDAEERWYRFFAHNENLLNSENIAAIYVMDEPVWNGVSVDEFSSALSIIKSTLPNIPTVSIEAYPVLEEIMIPKTLDWVGFDNYDSVDPANDKEWLTDLETVLERRSRPDQKIVIVASTQWLPYYASDAGIQAQDMKQVFESYYQVATQTPETIALIGYIWPGGLDHPDQLGARNLPFDVQQRLIQIGQAIIKR